MECPEGFVLTDDEVACIPFFQEDCGDLEVPVLGGGCRKVGPSWHEDGAVTSAPCCPATFPPVPEGAAAVAYVLAASDCQEDCGTHDKPFASIVEAIQSVDDGGAVLVGPGIYDEGLLIDKSLWLTGACPEKVHVVGYEPILVMPYPSVLSATIEVVNILTGFEQTNLMLAGDLVCDTALSDDKQFGMGLLAGWGANVVASGTAFRRNQTVGVVAFTEVTSVSLESCEISGTLVGGIASHAQRLI